MSTEVEFWLLSTLIFLVGVLLNPLLLLAGLKAGLRDILRRKTAPGKNFEPRILSLHQKTLEKIEKQIQTQIREELAKLSQRHWETLSELKKTIGGDYQKVGSEIQTEAEKYLREMHLSLASLVERAEKRVNEELSAELEKTKNEIEAYKKARMQKIDHEIVNIVEKTVYKTLGKSLDLESHMELIFKALNEAKSEGFFGENEN